MPSAAITARKLVIHREDTTVLDGLSCTIERGSLVGLIGPSGSGKTTLMRAIAGVQRISAGRLDVLGHPAGDAQLRSLIGYVSQSPAVYDDLTIVQNLRYFGVLTRSSRHRIDELIELLDLAPQRHRLVRQLSGGQRARVSLAVALLGDPQLLILDEPTVGLDPILQQELWKLFRQLADEGRTLLISSHVMSEAEHCQDIVLLRAGALLWSGSRRQLLKETATTSVEAAFLKRVAQKEAV